MRAMQTNLVSLARQIATEAHHGITRADGTAYIEHPATVAHYAQTLFSCTTITTAACWLHDVVEDTDHTLEDLRGLGIPLEVLAIVDAVTIRPGERYLEAMERASLNAEAKIVKLCDNRHNASTLDIFTETDRIRRASKYQEARRILLSA